MIFKTKIVLSVLFIALFVGCSGGPSTTAGSVWTGSVQEKVSGTRLDGENATSDGSISLTVTLFEFGYAELKTSGVIPGASGSWIQVLNKVTFKGFTGSNSVKNQKGTITLNFEIKDNEMILVSGFANQYFGATSNKWAVNEMNIDFAPIENNAFKKALFYKDLEETHWSGEILVQDPDSADANFDLVKNNGIGQLQVDFYNTASNSGSENTRAVVTIKSDNFYNNTDHSKFLPVNYVLIENTASYKIDIAAGLSAVEYFTSKTDYFSLKGIIDSLDLKDQKTITIKKEDAKIWGSVLSRQNVGDAQYSDNQTSSAGSWKVVKDIVLTKDLSYKTSISKK